MKSSSEYKLYRSLAKHLSFQIKASPLERNLVMIGIRTLELTSIYMMN